MIADPAQSEMLEPGGYAVAPVRMHHYARTRTGAVLQVSRMGPLQIAYVNPADDPQQRK